MIKKYVLDTNVYLTDFNAVLSFQDNDIYIPLKVLEEIDKHKTRQDSVGFNARQTIRILDELRADGSLQTGAKIGEGKGTLYVYDYTSEDMPANLDPQDPDNKIIATTLRVRKDLGDESIPVVLVSRDINMRVKCDALGIETQDYIVNHAVESIEHVYTGYKEHFVDDNVIDDFYQDLEIYLNTGDVILNPNEFVMLTSNTDSSKTALCRFVSEYMPVKKIVEHKQVWGLEARNKEQSFALDLLMNPDIKLVTLVGKAGTGKTLTAIAAGLEQIMSKNPIYSKLIVSRPVQAMGKDIGFLPGTMEEKMMPWLSPIQDNLENLLGGTKENLQMYMNDGTIEVEALTFIRGRSIANAFIIIDESQNLTKHELKTIITRVGENTKIILTGDIEQIDNAYVDETSNGLTHAVERLKHHNITGHIMFKKGERSELASIAAKEL
jgi:PhoH-like ATPase